MSPLVSVGLFVYNGERFLAKTLDSILNQTLSDFELIISDNGSTDGTREIVESYAKHDERIRYYRIESNRGAGWNARRVYELASSKYFKWAAADDLLEPDFLRRCVEILENDLDCVIAYAKTKEIDDEGNFIRYYVTPTGGTSSNDPVVRFRDMLLIYHQCYQIFGVMRMSALRRIPPQGIYVNADGVLLARMSLLGRFYEVPEPLFVSRRHIGQSATLLPARLSQQRICLTRAFSILPCPEWWDPSRKTAVTFPEFRQLREYFLSIFGAPISSADKFRCYAMLLHWMKIHSRPMRNDLLIAADQVLYKLQVGAARTDRADQEPRGGVRTDDDPDAELLEQLHLRGQQYAKSAGLARAPGLQARSIKRILLDAGRGMRRHIRTDGTFNR